jgi:predicted metal-dependent hydrolase
MTAHSSERGASYEKKRAVVEEWYREQIKQTVPALITKWAPIVGMKVNRFFVQRMKTKWGSCNHNSGSIRLNTDLAKKPPECLEYIVVHEMVHLLEPTHNDRFTTLMDRFIPVIPVVLFAQTQTGVNLLARHRFAR